MDEVKNTEFEKQQQLIVDNLALVNWCIKKYIFIGEDEYEDIFQEGCVGLILAARNFKEELGYQFSTYAIQMITGTIKKYKREKSNKYRGMKLGRKVLDNLDTISKTMKKLRVDEITAEVIEHSGLTPEDIEKTYITFISKDQTISISESEEVTIEDILATQKDSYEEVISDKFVDIIIEDVKNRLSGIDADLFEEVVYASMIGGEKVRQPELAMRYGLSQAQISRKLKSIRKVVREVHSKLDRWYTVKVVINLEMRIITTLIL